MAGYNVKRLFFIIFGGPDDPGGPGGPGSPDGLVALNGGGLLVRGPTWQGFLGLVSIVLCAFHCC